MRAIRVAEAVSRMVGDQLAVVPMPAIDALDTTPGVYVVYPERYDNDIVGAQFTFNRNNLSGAADSAHAAIPGDLTLERRGGFSAIAEVVAKCFTKRTVSDRLSRIKSGLHTMEAMREAGFLTIDPLAVIMARVDGETQLVLLTEYNPTLTTMDNLPWGRGVTDEVTVANAVLGASALGAFNALGHVHGDAKVKNVAQDETGRVGMIDYETSHPFKLDDQMGVRTAVLEDFSKYLDSLIKKGFFGVKGQKVPAVFIRETLDAMVVAYIEHWADQPQEIRDLVWEQTDAAIDVTLPGILEQRGHYTL